MATIKYGYRTFTKFSGYYGEKVTCPSCGKTYSRAVVRYRRWFTLFDIPIFPYKTFYTGKCPVCAGGDVLDKEEAIHLLKETPEAADQELTVYGKHILANKKKGFLAVDNSYELWVKDNLTGEEICVAANITKEDIRNGKKERGLSELPVTEV